MIKKTTKPKVSSNKRNTLKKKILEALKQSLGIVTTACKQVNCSRKTFYQYYKDDKEFKKTVDDINEICLDHVESKLLDLIEAKHPTAIIFYLKTKGKRRGYIEKVEGNSCGNIESNVLTRKPTRSELIKIINNG